MTYDVEIVEVPPRLLAVTRFHVAEGDLPDIGEQMGAAFGRVMGALSAAGEPAHGPAVARYQPTGDGFDVAAGFRIASPVTPGNGVDNLDLSDVEVAHTTHVGAYEDLPSAYAALRARVEEQGRKLDDSAVMWEEYLTGPEVPPEQTVTEIYWPVVP